MSLAIQWYREKFLHELASLREPALKQLILLMQVMKLRAAAPGGAVLVPQPLPSMEFPEPPTLADTPPPPLDA